jgi:hypothetical protein
MAIEVDHVVEVGAVGQDSGQLLQSRRSQNV